MPRCRAELLSIDWSTGSETGNVGFNLYVEDANGKHKLNDQLIPSTGFTTHDPQDYHFAANVGLFSGAGQVLPGGHGFSTGRRCCTGRSALDQGVREAHRPAPRRTGRRSLPEDARLQKAEDLADSQSVNQALQERLQAQGAPGRQAIPSCWPESSAIHAVPAADHQAA